MKSIKILLGILGGLSAIPTSLQAQNISERLEKLEQDQKIIQRQWELEQEKPKESAKVIAGKEGFGFKSGDGDYQIKLRGLIQLDGRYFLEANPKGTDTLVARRIRPILEGTLGKRFDFRFTPDFGQGTTVLFDAYFDIKLFPELKIRAGKFKPPVGLERLQSAAALVFVERGLPTNLVPNRDLGVELFGDVAEVFNYALGIFNGTTDGGNGDTDLNDRKEIAGRLFVQPFQKTNITALKELGIGVGGSYGRQKGNSANTSLPTYKSAGQQTVFRYTTDGAVAANTIIADGDIFRISPQLYYYWGPLGLLGEYTLSSQVVNLPSTNAKKTLKHQAYQGEISFVLTGEKASYKGVKPKRPFDPAKGQWGAVELAARYGELKIDKDTFPTYASASASVRQVKEFSGGVNWYLNDWVKVAADYEHSLFKGGAAAGTNRASERAFLTRLQLSF